jgi:hypothetical protein
VCSTWVFWRCRSLPIFDRAAGCISRWFQGLHSFSGYAVEPSLQVIARLRVMTTRTTRPMFFTNGWDYCIASKLIWSSNFDRKNLSMNWAALFKSDIVDQWLNAIPVLSMKTKVGKSLSESGMPLRPVQSSVGCLVHGLKDVEVLRRTSLAVISSETQHLSRAHHFIRELRLIDTWILVASQRSLIWVRMVASGPDSNNLWLTYK